MKQRTRRKLLAQLSADDSFIRRIAHDVMKHLARSVMDHYFQRLIDEQNRQGLR